METLPPIPELPLNDATRFLELEVRWWGQLVHLGRYRDEAELRVGPEAEIPGPRDGVLAFRAGDAWFDGNGDALIDGEERRWRDGELSYRMRAVPRSASVPVERPHDVVFSGLTLGGVFGMAALVAALLLVPFESSGAPISETYAQRWALTTLSSVTPPTRPTKKRAEAPAARARVKGKRPDQPHRRPTPSEVRLLQSALSQAVRGVKSEGLRKVASAAAHVRARSASDGGALVPVDGFFNERAAGTSLHSNRQLRFGCNKCGGEMIYAKRDLTPRVKVRQPVVVGSMDKEIIRRVVRANAAGVRACYERALQRRPGLAGRVVVEFVISPSGVVQSARPVEDEVAIGNCVAKRARRWRFPASQGGGVVVVRYPFAFRAG